MLKKLRTKFICFTMILVTVMLCAIFVTVYTITAQNLEADSLQMLHSLSDKRKGPEAPPDAGPRPPKVRESYLILQQTAQDTWSAQGSEFFDLTDQEYLNTLLQEASASGDRTGVLKDYSLRYLRSDAPHLQYIFLDISAEITTLRHLVRTCLVIGFISLGLFFGISLLLADIAVRPVEKAWQQQKQFVADASHELKTPLAVILTNAELMGEDSYSPEEQQQFSQNVLCKARQMRHLVENLLELARLDNVAPAMQPMDLSVLLENSLLPFEPAFFENGMLLDSRVSPGLWVRGSAQHLQQVIEIFLDNALKYADPGTVTVTLDRAGSNALLSVENLGSPLSGKEAQDIFLRFYRADTARSSGGSYGLGLSIAQSIIHQYDGKIWAEGTQTGNRFCVILPLCCKDSKESPQLPQ